MTDAVRVAHRFNVGFGVLVGGVVLTVLAWLLPGFVVAIGLLLAAPVVWILHAGFDPVVNLGLPIGIVALALFALEGVSAPIGGVELGAGLAGLGIVMLIATRIAWGPA